MERLTKRLDNGVYTATEFSAEQILAALAKYEDVYESIQEEHELVRLNMEVLKQMQKGKSATYTMLIASLHMLEEMRERIEESSEEIANRLESLKKLTENDGADEDGYIDID